MGQNPVPPVNIPIPTKIPKMGGAPTNQNGTIGVEPRPFPTARDQGSPKRRSGPTSSWSRWGRAPGPMQAAPWKQPTRTAQKPLRSNRVLEERFDRGAARRKLMAKLAKARSLKPPFKLAHGKGYPENKHCLTLFIFDLPCRRKITPARDPKQ